MLPRYETLHRGRAYLEGAIVRPVRRRVAELATLHGVADRRVAPLEPEPEPIAEQLPLEAFMQSS